jgi:hypothetical protein
LSLGYAADLTAALMHALRINRVDVVLLIDFADFARFVEDHIRRA